MLSVNGSLNSVTVVCADDWGRHDGPQQDDCVLQLAGAMNAWAAALTTNTTLAEFRLGVRLNDPYDHVYSYDAVRAADAALRGVPRVGQSLLLLKVSFAGGGEPGQRFSFL